MHVITSKLDAHTLRNWETLMAKEELPIIQSLIDFSLDRCQILEVIENSRNVKKDIKNEKKHFSNKVHSFAIRNMSMKCYLCKGP